MIKQIWFIRNERRLINSLCFTITGLILFYSILSIWALANSELAMLLQLDETIIKPSLYSLMFKRVNLYILPLILLVVCSMLLWFSNHIKSARYCTDEQSAARKKQIKRDLLIGTNLFTTLVFSFLQIERLNIAKQIAGFGFVPIYLCIAGVLVFYATMIKKLFNTK
ncbi:MAG: hypothetical protein WAX04_09690 [Oscillospiraceae bacterium]